jgi:hypothetical protein
MLDIVGAEDDDAAHLAADPVLARFAQDGVLAHRKDPPGEIARHDVSCHPVGHRSGRGLAGLVHGLRKRARDDETGGVQIDARFAHPQRGPQAKSGRQRGRMVVIIQPAARARFCGIVTLGHVRAPVARDLSPAR